MGLGAQEPPTPVQDLEHGVEKKQRRHGKQKRSVFWGRIRREAVLKDPVVERRLRAVGIADLDPDQRLHEPAGEHEQHQRVPAENYERTEQWLRTRRSS